MSDSPGSKGLMRGASALVAAQAFVTVGQFAYSSFTARFFTPVEFGEFAAALSLQAIFLVLASSGIPAYLMSVKSATCAIRSVVRGLALAAGIAGSLLYQWVIPYWLTWLQSEGGARYALLLTLSVLVYPLAVVESTILRRAHRRLLDALIFLLAFVVSTSAAVASALITGDPASLAVAPLVNGITLLLLSWFGSFRRREAGSDRPEGAARHISTVTAQNSAFLVLNQSPGWSIGAISGSSDLGAYSRSSTLASTPGNALSTALVRSLQSLWRGLPENVYFASAVQKTLTLATTISASAFFLLAALAPVVVPLWLGPGWSQVVPFVQVLAIGSAIYVPYSVIVSALEVRMLLAPVRWSQGAYAVGVAAGIVAYVVTSEPIYGVVAVLAGQSLALLCLLWCLARAVGTAKLRLMWSVAEPALWALGSAMIGGVATRLAAVGTTQYPSPTGSALELAAGLAASAVYLALTFRWHGSAAILRARGITLPRWLVARPRFRRD